MIEKESTDFYHMKKEFYATIKNQSDKWRNQSLTKEQCSELSESLISLFKMNQVKIQPLKLIDTDLLIVKMKTAPTSSQIYTIKETVKDLDIKALILKDDGEKVFSLPEEELNKLGYFKKK